MRNKTHQKHNSIKPALLTTLCLCLSVLFCAGGAVAWLSRNRYAKSQDMTLHAATTANLVISSTLGTNGIANPDILTQATSPFEVSMTKTTAGLIACTHDPSTSNAMRLSYVTNTDQLNRVTGLALEGETLGMAMAEKDVHFVEYVVYLAAAGGTLEHVDLTATVTTPASTENDTYRALSVDFWVDGSIKGTLNVAGKDYQNTFADLKSVSLLSDTTIPLNTAGYIAVTMRVYFDGALMKDATHTYLTAANLDTNDMPLGLTFSAVPHT